MTSNSSRKDGLVELTAVEKRARAGGSRPGEPHLPQFSDDALALRFTEHYGAELPYVHSWGKWIRWDECRWVVDSTLAVFDLIRAVCRRAATECDRPRQQAAIVSAKTVAAVERLAKSDRRHAAPVEQWDRHAWLLPTPGGEVDLKTGQVEAAKPEHHMTKMTPVAPSGRCTLWMEFLHRVSDGDKELKLYLQRVAGYCLTGSVEEQAVFFLHGTGQNGNGVFVHTLAKICGEFHRAAPMEMFFALESPTLQASSAETALRTLISSLVTFQPTFPVAAAFKNPVNIVGTLPRAELSVIEAPPESALNSTRGARVHVANLIHGKSSMPSFFKRFLTSSRVLS